MTDQTNDEEAARRRAEWEAEQSATERAHAYARNGALWGAWKPNRLTCRACGEEIVHSAKQAAFLDVEETFHSETIDARAFAAFDLMFRKSIDIPDWVSLESELWRQTQHNWANHKLDDIIMKATVVDALGAYGDYGRACDGASHVFIRDCPRCHDTDPLNLCPELRNLGMEKVEPPHNFLETLRRDQESKQKRARDQIERMIKTSVRPNNRAHDIPLPKDKLASIDSGEPNRFKSDACQACGSKRNPSWKFCGKCGSC